MVDLIKGTFDDPQFDPFGWKAIRAAIKYYSQVAATDPHAEEDGRRIHSYENARPHCC